MKSPFKYGSIVTDNYFVNRNKEINKLHNNFYSNLNTVLISPRRWGKTSLIKEACRTIKNKNIKFVFP